MRSLFLKIALVLVLAFINNSLALANSQVLDSLNKLKQSGDFKKQQAAYIGLAQYYFGKDSLKSEQNLKKVLSNIGAIPNEYLTEILNLKITFYDRYNKIDDIITTVKIALEEAEKRKDSSLIAHCHKQLSLNYYKKYDYELASKHLNKASEIYESLNDLKSIGSVILQKGRIEYAKGNYTKAMEKALKAADIFKATDQNRQLAVTYLQLGNMHYFLSELNQASNYYELSTDYYLLANDSIGWAISYSNLGLIKLVQDSFSKALEIQYKALPQIIKSKREISIGNTYHYMGECYIGLNQADSAEKYIRESAIISKKSKYYIGHSFDNVSFGKIALLRNDIDSAIYFGKIAAKVLDSIKNFELEKEISLFFSKCYEKKGDIQSAFEHLKHYQSIRDSLDFNQKDIKSKASTEQSKIERAEYELKLSKQRELIKMQENKNQQFLIIILSIITIVSIFFAALIATTNRKNKSLNIQLKDKQKLLEVELTNKQALLKEIHHRVKNNLQIISSMLSIQSKYVEDETMHSIIKESQNRIKSMALIHESLYKREKDEHSLFSAYVKELIPNLINTYHVDESKISLTMEVEDIELSLDDSIPCGLIINEIVSNSLKHAFPDGKEGRISIKMHKEGENIHLLIADNGVGFPDKKTPNSDDSFGFLLIESLLSQLEAKVKINTKKGVSYHINWQAKVDKMLD